MSTYTGDQTCALLTYRTVYHLENLFIDASAQYKVLLLEAYTHTCTHATGTSTCTNINVVVYVLEVCQRHYIHVFTLITVCSLLIITLQTEKKIIKQLL